MKSLKSPKIIAATAMVVFGFSTLGHAEEALKGARLKEGVSVTELKNISDGTAEAVLEGRSLFFAGSIPKECATGARLTEEYRNKTHLVTIRLAEKCEMKGYTPDPKAERVYLSSALKAIELQDKSGKIAIIYKSRASEDPRAKTNESAPELLNVPIIESAAERAAKLAAEQEKELKAARNEFSKRLAESCKKGDFEGLNAELEANKELLGGDLVNALLAKSQDARLARFKADINKAKTAEEAKQAFDAYVTEADSKGWEADAMDLAYVNKRAVILRNQVAAAKSDKKADLLKVADAVKSLKDEVEDLNSDFSKKLSEGFAAEYQNLGNYALARDDFETAAKMMERAAEATSDAKLSVEVRSQAAAAYLEKSKECFAQAVKKGFSGNMQINQYTIMSVGSKAEKACGKYAKKAGSIAEALGKEKERAAKKNEDASEDFMAFAQAYHETHSSAVAANNQVLQEAAMEAYQKSMERMYGGMSRTPAGGGSSGSYFNLGR